MAAQSIHVLIADDHDGVRRGIKTIIGSNPRFEIVGEARDGNEALRKANALQPDMVILDVKMPGMSGLEVARKLQHTQPDTKILALSSFDNAEYILNMFEVGVGGYLTKDEAPRLLVRALNGVWNGTTRWMSTALIEKTGLTPYPQNVREASLTHREIEIMRLLKDGLSAQQIANELDLSLARVDKFLRVLMAKRKAKSIEELRNTD